MKKPKEAETAAQADPYETRAVNVLAERSKELEKAAQALVFSYSVQGGDVEKDIGSKESLGLEYNIFRPGNPKEIAKSGETLVGSVMRHLAFIISEGNRNRGEFPPPQITRAVEHQQAFAR